MRVLDLVVLSKNASLNIYKKRGIGIPIVWDIYYDDFQSVGIEIKLNRKPERKENIVFKRVRSDLIKSERLNLYRNIVL